MDFTKNIERPGLKLCFEIIDDEGTWIKCCATAGNAKSFRWHPGIEIVIFFGQALASTVSTSSMLYMFNTSTIVPIGMKTPPRRQMEHGFLAVAAQSWEGDTLKNKLGA